MRRDAGEYDETNPTTTMGLPLGATIGWKKNGKGTKRRGEEIEGKVEGGAAKRGREPRGAQNKSSGSLGLQVSRAFLEEGSVQTLGEAGGKEI